MTEQKHHKQPNKTAINNRTKSPQTTENLTFSFIIKYLMLTLRIKQNTQKNVQKTHSGHIA